MSVNVESSLDLSPEIIKLRDSYLNALEKMPKEEHDSLIRKQLEKEENDKNRMALLACRTLLLREKTVVLRAEIDDDHPSTMLKKFRDAGVEWPVWVMPTGAREEEQTATAGKVAEKAFKKGYNVAARVHVYLFGNAIGT